LLAELRLPVSAAVLADQLDRVIDACGSVFHIRDAIAEARAQADTGACTVLSCDVSWQRVCVPS
jgi:hypothetical protein